MATVSFFYFGSLLLCFFGSFSKQTKIIEYNDGRPIVVEKGSNFCFWLIFGVLTFVSACRSGFVDTVSYRLIYEAVGTDIKVVHGDELRIEEGFRYICYLLNHISTDSQLLLILVSILVNFSVFKLIDLYSEDRWLSVLIYISTVYLVTMNIMRQYIVVAVFLLAIPLLFKKKWWLFLVIALALSTVHSTALIAAIVIVLCNGKFLNIRVFVVALAMIILSVVSSAGFLNFLESADLNDYAAMYQTIDKAGVNTLRVIVQSVPAVLAIICYYFVEKKNDMILPREYSFFMNLNVLNFASYIFSMRNNYLARVAVYFEIFSVITIPFLLTRILYKKELSLYVKIFTIVLYGIYFYFLVQSFGNASIEALTPFFIGD